jgi:hypothetical protein
MISLSNAAVFGLLTIYFALVPISAETQPIILLLLGFYLILKNGSFARYFLYFACFVVIYSAIGFLVWGGDLLSAVKYISFFVITVSVINLNPEKISTKASIYAPHFFLIIGLSQKIYPQLLEPLYRIINYRIYESLTNEIRGLPLIAPEPSYMALLLAAIYLLNKSIYNSNRSLISQKSIAFSNFSVFICLIFTGSFLALIFITAILTPFLIKGRLRIAFLIAAGIFFLYFSAEVSSNQLFVRLEGVANAVVEQISEGNMLQILSAAEPSGSTRLILGYLAIYSAFINPLGGGVGYFKNNWYAIAEQSSLDFLQNHAVLGTQYVTRIPTEPQTIFYGLISDFGFIVFAIFALFIFVRHKSIIYSIIRSWDLLIFSLFILLFQSSITSPFLGLVIALAIHKEKLNAVKNI